MPGPHCQQASPQILSCFLSGLPIPSILHTEARQRLYSHDSSHLCALLQALLDFYCQIITETQLYVNEGERRRHEAASASHTGHYSRQQAINMHTEGGSYLYLYTQVSMHIFEVTKISRGGLKSCSSAVKIMNL